MHCTLIREVFTNSNILSCLFYLVPTRARGRVAEWCLLFCEEGGQLWWGEREKKTVGCLHHKCVHSPIDWLSERVQKGTEDLKVDYLSLFMLVTPWVPVNEPTKSSVWKHNLISLYCLTFKWPLPALRAKANSVNGTCKVMELSLQSHLLPLNVSISKTASLGFSKPTRIFVL